MMKRKPRQFKSSKTLDDKNSAFDVWLNRSLHELFDDVANEPIPDDLLKLIQDKSKS